MNKPDLIRKLSGLVLILVGLTAVARFDFIKVRLLFLSQDGQIVPQTLLQLRIFLLSLGILGIVLLLKHNIIALFNNLIIIIDSFEPRKFLIVLLSSAFLLRALSLLMPFHLWGDWQTYNELAWTWSQTGSYSVNGIPYAYRPPGYPFFLMLIYEIFGQSPRLGAAFNVLFGTATVYLIYKFASKFMNEKIAGYAAIILAFFPSQILFVNKLASETLFTMLLFLALYVMVLGLDKKRAVMLLLCGIVLGLAALTKGIALAFVFVPLIYILLYLKWSPAAIRNALFMVLGFLLVVVPWMTRNYVQKGSFSIATQTGINLLIGNAPGSGMGWNQTVTEEFDIDDPARQVEIDRQARNMAWEYIKDNPAGFVKRGILKLGYYYAVDMEGVWNELIDAADKGRFDLFAIIALLAESYYLAVLLLFFMGAIAYAVNRGEPLSAKVLLFGTILYWSAVYFVFFGDGRFHHPIVPIMCILGAYYLIRTIKSGVRNLS